MKNKLLILSVLLLSFFISSAQTPDKKWSVGPDFGVFEYGGDLGTYFVTV